MNSAPHLARRRLTAPLADHQVVLLEAGGGAGKTALAFELAEALDAVPVHVQIDPDMRSEQEVVSEAARSLGRLGFPNAAAAASQTETLSGLVSALEAVGSDSVLIVDDVHHCTWELATALDELADVLPRRHRLVVAGHRLTSTVDAATGRLDDADLALTFEETRDLGRTVSSGEITQELVAEVHAITGGWVAPTVSALGSRAVVDNPAVAWLSVHDIVRSTIAKLSSEHQATLERVAVLPKLHPTVTAALEADEAVAAARDAGVPIRRVGGAWYHLANPFAEALAGDATLSPAELSLASRAYAAEGDVLLGCRLLRRELGDEAVARLLGEIEPGLLLRAHGGELLDVIDGLDDEEVARHPRILLVASRVASLIGDVPRKRSIVDRNLHLSAGTAAEAVAEADDLLQRIWLHEDDRRALAERADALSDAHGEDDEVAARLAEFHARRLSFADGVSPQAAVSAWEHAAQAWEQAGYRPHAAAVLVAAAVNGAFDDAEFALALELLERAVVRASGSPAVLLLALLYKGMVLADLGRYDEAESCFERAEPIARALRAHGRQAGIDWFRARIASQTGDRAGTLAAVRRAEQSDAVDAGGGMFLAADAATLLARVGLDDEADARLSRALAADTGIIDRVPLAAMDVAARRGDLDGALEWQARMDERGVCSRREAWRIPLLLAWAADEADERRAPWAAQAFDGAAALGHPQLPFVREPTIARRLVALAAGAGSRTAAQLVDHGFATIRVLGAFEVDIPGTPETSVTGTQAQALKFLAVRGGRVTAEALIETLWPDTDPERGRSRLRVVLSRLKNEVGDLVERDGELLVLAPGTAVDAIRFDDLAQQALIEDDLGRAEAAVAVYRGPLLPDDLYDDWVSTERDRLGWRYVALLDRLAEGATESGDVQRALSLLYVAIDEEPDIEDRYLWAARLLLEQSRPGRARVLLERCVGVLDHEGASPSDELLDLLAQLES